MSRANVTANFLFAFHNFSWSGSGQKKSSWTILVHKRIAKWLAINSRQVEKTPSIVRFMKPQKASLGNDTLQVLKKQTK